MGKSMKSFRLDDLDMERMREVADSLGVSSSDALRLALLWAAKSGMVEGLGEARRAIGFGNYLRYYESVVEAALVDGEVKSTVKAKLYMVGVR